MKAIEAIELSKTYPGGKKAVINSSFSLEAGEIFGFLGPNGAGKTTVVKLLNGMLAPSGGSCRVFSLNPALEPTKIHGFSGVLTEHAQMYGYMTGLKNLIFYGKLFGLSAEKATERAEELLNKLELSEAKERKLDAYSTGMRQRLSLARTLMHRPKLLFLDEPTSGLDPESVLYVNNLIKSLAQNEGTTVFLCTHQLRYAQEICTSYGLINEGSLLAVGNIETLRARIFPGLTLSITADRLPEAMPAKQVGENEYEMQVDSEAEIPHIVRRIVDENGSIYSVTARRLSLEEIYLALLAETKK